MDCRRRGVRVDRRLKEIDSENMVVRGCACRHLPLTVTV